MKNSKEENNKVKSDLNKIEDILEEMSAPNLPNIDAEWDLLEKRIDSAGAKKVVPFLYKARIVTAYAAGIILLISIGFAYLNMKTYTIQTSENKNIVTLKDSSKVWLNANSSISYNAGYGITNRKISLTGEAFFKVQKSSQAFIVTTKAANIKVTGTQFNVRSNSLSTEVGVTEGRVEFASASSTKSKVVLTKGLYSKCQVNENPDTATKIETEGYPQWIENKLVYRNAILKNILLDVEALYDIEIELVDSDFGNIEVSGIIIGKTPNEMLNTLCILIGKKCRVRNNIYEIY